MTNKSDKIEGTTEAWENGQLGRDEHYVAKVQLDESMISDALALQMISIRLPKTLIEDLKMIGKINGIGYQPLIRQVLKRFADSEKKQILIAEASKVADKDEVYIEESEKFLAHA